MREWLLRRHPHWRRSTVYGWTDRQVTAVYLKERRKEARLALEASNGVYKRVEPGRVVQGELFEEV